MKTNYKTVFKTISISLLSLIGLIIIIVLIATISINHIVSKTGKNLPYFVNTAKNAFQQNPYKESKFINFLVLGLDKRDDLLEKTATTDTIMLASINTENGKVNLISLPRDLWNFDLKMKINGIYPLSVEQNKSFDFLESEYFKIFGVKIEKTIIITTNNLIGLVNAIGGVDVNLEKGFIDQQYPNQDYIDNPNSGASIYKTIEFPSGINHLNQSNITEFVRSRKGVDSSGQETTDIGRVIRQQLLIEAILAKIRSKEFLSNYNNVINLYNFWQKDISSNITDFDFVAIGLKLKDKFDLLIINKINLTIGNNSKEGLIYHPNTNNFTNQWIYLPTGSDDYSKIQDFIKNSIN